MTFTRSLLAVLALVALASCAEINKPITPGDTWRERSTSDLNAPPR